MGPLPCERWPCPTALHIHGSQMGAVPPSPHVIQGETERVNDLPTATQLVGGRARTGGRVSQILPSLCLDSLPPKALGHPSPGRGPPERPPARTLRLSVSGSERAAFFLLILPCAHPAAEVQDVGAALAMWPL